MSNELHKAIEDFVAHPQTSQSYVGSLAIGFEIRRDLPKPFTGGFWFSAVAVREILFALALHGGANDVRCGARNQSLPEPADCNWPLCGCDPYADKVIAALQESGALREAGDAF